MFVTCWGAWLAAGLWDHLGEGALSRELHRGGGRDAGSSPRHTHRNLPTAWWDVYEMRTSFWQHEWHRWACGWPCGGAAAWRGWRLQAVPAITGQTVALTWPCDSTRLARRGASESYQGLSLVWMVSRVFLMKGVIFFNASSQGKLEWRGGAPLQDLRLFTLSQFISS